MSGRAQGPDSAKHGKERLAPPGKEAEQSPALGFSVGLVYLCFKNSVLLEASHSVSSSVRWRC